MTAAPPTPPPAAARPSLLRAWFYLVGLSLRRQVRARQMTWLAFGLLIFSVLMTGLATAADLWHRPRLQFITAQTQLMMDALHPGGPAQAFTDAYAGAARAALRGDASAAEVFSRWVVAAVFLGFLLPLWSLSFATEAIGGQREQNNLIWLLARPLPRPAIYLAKFVALLPWAVGFNVGGFALLCAAGGPEGVTCLRLFWPAVLCAALAFAALFQLIGAAFRRPAVVAIGYSFFLEILLGNMPGYLKRVSVGYYAHCMMLESAARHGVQMDAPSVYWPVDGMTAMTVLLTATAALLVLGMAVFSRMEYHEGV